MAALLKLPVVGKLVGLAVPTIAKRLGNEPLVAIGGLAAFLAWVATFLPPKIQMPVQIVVGVLGLLTGRAVVWPDKKVQEVVKGTQPVVEKKTKVPIIVAPVTKVFEKVVPAAKPKPAPAPKSSGGLKGLAAKAKAKLGGK